MLKRIAAFFCVLGLVSGGTWAAVPKTSAYAQRPTSHREGELWVINDASTTDCTTSIGGGAGVLLCMYETGTGWVNTGSGGGGADGVGYDSVHEEGLLLTKRAIVDFVGPQMTCEDDTVDTTTCTLVLTNDGTMAAETTTSPASGAAIKTYVDGQDHSTGTLSSVAEDLTPQLGGDLDLNGKNFDFPSVLNVSDVKDEDTLVSNSATMLATQQSIKAYVDGQDHTDFVPNSSVVTDHSGYVAGLGSVVGDTTPQLGGQLDVNGKCLGDGTLEQVCFVDTPVAVSYVEITNGITGVGPTIAPGGEAHLDLNLQGAGTGKVVIGGSTSAITFNGATSGTVTVKPPAVAGTEDFVLQNEYTVCAVYEDLGAETNRALWDTINPATVTKVGCRCNGTCTTKATISLEDHTLAADMTHAAVTCATTGAIAYQAVSGVPATLSTGEGVFFDVDNTPVPLTDDYTICIGVKNNAS